MLLPYFTVNVWERSGIYNAYVTGGTYADLQDTAELEEILTDCLRQEEDEGTIRSYGLRYLRRDLGLYLRMAFVDMSMEQATHAGDHGLLSANRRGGAAASAGRVPSSWPGGPRPRWRGPGSSSGSSSPTPPTS